MIGWVVWGDLLVSRDVEVFILWIFGGVFLVIIGFLRGLMT